jgi:hypothetical protein
VDLLERLIPALATRYRIERPAGKALGIDSTFSLALFCLSLAQERLHRPKEAILTFQWMIASWVQFRCTWPQWGAAMRRRAVGPRRWRSWKSCGGVQLPLRLALRHRHRVCGAEHA